jgi:hypothetical protein
MCKPIAKIILLIIFLVTMINGGTPTEDLICSVAGQGVMGLDFSDKGNNEQIALFIINCNDTPGGFEITFKFTNGCAFKNGSRSIPMTNLVLDKVSGILGTKLTAPENIDILHNLSGSEYTWNPGDSMTTATENYIIEMKASWDDPSRYIWGFYYETIKATITAK